MTTKFPNYFRTPMFIVAVDDHDMAIHKQLQHTAEQQLALWYLPRFRVPLQCVSSPPVDVKQNRRGGQQWAVWTIVGKRKRSCNEPQEGNTPPRPISPRDDQSTAQSREQQWGSVYPIDSFSYCSISRLDPMVAFEYGNVHFLEDEWYCFENSIFHRFLFTS